MLLALAAGRSTKMVHMIIRDQHLALTTRDHEEIWDYVLRSDNIEYLKLLLSYSKKFSILIRFYNGLSILGWAIQCLALRCVTYLIATTLCALAAAESTKFKPPRPPH